MKRPVLLIISSIKTFDINESSYQRISYKMIASETSNIHEKFTNTFK